ncbi:MAG: aldo/keto reductase [Planctomycetes bacterium]|nr:aldo/keto reductase [Planctomycetota bacterium]
MDYLQLGDSDLQVSRLCLGTWNMAGQEGWGPENDKTSIDLIRRAQDSGCNFFDTAHGYGKGRAEALLGKALAQDDRRERAVIATKVMQCPPPRLEGQLDAALRRLRTDYVDLYLVHWPWPRGDLRAFMDKMSEMKQKEKARQIGVSNFNLQEMEVAAEYGVVCLQAPYNVLWRQIEDDILPFCRENGIAVTSYSSLAQGLLTGRFSRGSEQRAGIRNKNVLFDEPVFTKAREAAAVVDAVADEIGCTSSQAALAWLLQTEGMVAPIVGISKWGQWQDNLGALDVRLSDAEYRRISEAGMQVWEMLPADGSMWGWKPR